MGAVGKTVHSDLLLSKDVFMIRLTFIFFSILFSLNVLAQTAPADYQQAYQKGERALRDKKYDLAREYFAPLTSARYQNELVPYSHYFMALACLKSDRLAESRTYLRQLESRYPNWPKIADARYLYANVLLEEDQFTAGVDALKRLPEARMKQDIESLEAYYLAQCTNLSTLRQLHTKYPNDAIIAENLVALIQRNSTNKADLDLAARLTTRFSLKPRTAPTGPNIPVVTAPKGKKSAYTIAVLFPFRMNELNSANNQFVVDLYEGIRLAVKKLQSEGITVNVLAYEVDNTAESMQKVFGDPQFQQSDVLIGPLYPVTYELATTWAAERNIPIVNPISTNSSLLENQTYLVQPSVESQARLLFQFSQRFTPKSTYIAYGNTRQDSLLAATYAQVAKTNGVQVLGMKRGRSESLAAELKGKKPGHILAAFTGSGEGPGVISWNRSTNLGVPLLVPYEAFNTNTSPASTFSGSNVYFFDSMFSSDTDPAVLDFRQKYMTQINTLPSSYAYLGYDTMLFFGRMLGKYGSDFTKGLKSQPYKDGYTLGGFDYRQSTDNQNFNVLKFSNYQFIQVK